MPSRSRQSGLSLIELMVGITIGLIVVAGASVMMTNQVSQNSHLLQETQLQQDLRAAADLIDRDLRRAGYWQGSATGVWAPGATVATNVYAPTSPYVQDDNKLYYGYMPKSSVNTGTVPLSTESFGYKWDQTAGTLSALNGATFALNTPAMTFSLPSTPPPNWQPLTDPNTVTITDFKVNLVTQPVQLADFKTPAPTCPTGFWCPCLLVRRFDISITGQAAHDPNVVRTITLSTRVRNDQVVDSCVPP